MIIALACQRISTNDCKIAKVVVSVNKYANNKVSQEVCIVNQCSQMQKSKIKSPRGK